MMKPQMTRADLMANWIGSAITGALFAGLVAWGLGSNVWLVAIVAFAGAGLMLVGTTILIRILNPPPAESMRRVTEGPDAPESAIEAVEVFLHEQRGLLVSDSVVTALQGAAAGGLAVWIMFADSGLRLVLGAVGAVAGGALGFGLSWFFNAGLMTGAVLLVRRFRRSKRAHHDRKTHMPGGDTVPQGKDKQMQRPTGK